MVKLGSRLIGLLHALGSMGRFMQAVGKVELRGDAYAERLAGELRQRYGKGVMAGPRQCAGGWAGRGFRGC